jgi:CubicO group peptidase (beta-lactamase class C family)
MVTSAESRTGRAGRDLFPAATTQGGWRCLRGDAEIRELGGFDPQRLRDVAETQMRLCAGNAFGIFIARRGMMVAEFASDDCTWDEPYEIHSCSKSFASLAWGLLLDEQRRSGPDGLSLSTPVYRIIPPLGAVTDPRKEHITIEHLLSMTSGIRGERNGVWGLETDSWSGPFEFALGLAPDRYGHSVSKLVADPGTSWDYSDPGYVHLGLAFRHATGQEMADFVEERIFRRIGVGRVSWSLIGGEGHIGPHTPTTHGVFISGRDLARMGLLLARGGVWGGETIVPAWWIDLATKPSQAFNPKYGLGFWTNRKLAYLPGAPADMFLMAGYRSNRCYVIPSLDLVVVRVGTGPLTWDEQPLVEGILDAVT